MYSRSKVKRTINCGVQSGDEVPSPAFGDTFFPCLKEKEDWACSRGATPKRLSESPDGLSMNLLFFFLKDIPAPDAAVRVGDMLLGAEGRRTVDKPEGWRAAQC